MVISAVLRTGLGTTGDLITGGRTIGFGGNFFGTGGTTVKSSVNTKGTGFGVTGTFFAAQENSTVPDKIIPNMFFSLIIKLLYNRSYSCHNETFVPTLSLVQTRIEQACQQHQRESVSLVAVSKTKPASMIEDLFALGQECFAENYLQEATAKIQQLAHLQIKWHFIGAIQSNKTRAIAENFHWIQTVDRIKIAEKLNTYAIKPLQICIQVNTSNEASKAGCLPDEALLLAQQIQKLPKLTLRGLMVIPKPQTTLELQVMECQKAKHLFDNLNKQGFRLDTLSMGMSSDLEAAIASGSTMVRIGTDLFGSRT